MRPDRLDPRKETKMTQVLHFPTAAAPTGFLARFAVVVANYRLYRETLAELESLGDRELSDLGIARTSIRDIARESVYGA